MAGVELANAWVNIIPSTKDIAPAIKKSLGEAEAGAEKSGGSIGSKLSSGISKTLKVGVASAGAAAGGLLATSIAKGMGRLNSIDQASAKLEALGNSGSQVQGIMDNALASVKGTAFGIGEAAGTAATLVASGLKPGEELEKVLKGVADSASIAGTGMDEMGLIWGKVAAKGKLDGEVVAQMLERQIPIYDILSQKLGVASGDIAKMVSDGKVDFQTFADAMTEYVGGGAVRMGETVQGAVQNAGAAMGRFGAALTGPAFGAAPELISSFTTVFDKMTEAVKPAAAHIGETLTPALEQLAGVVESRVAPMMGDAAGKFGEMASKAVDFVVDPSTWEHLGDVFNSVKDTAERLWPSIESLGGSFLSISQNISVATWNALTDALNAAAPLIDSVLVPMVDAVARFADQNPAVMEAIVTAFLGFKVVSGPVSTAAGAITNLGGAASFLKKATASGKIGESLLEIAGGAKSANPVVASLGKNAVGAGKGLTALGRFGQVAGSALGFVNPWVAGITAVVGGLTWFFTKTETGQHLIENFSRNVTAQIDWVREKFGQFTGWFKDAWDGITGLFQGDYRASLGAAFGLEEDSGLVDKIFKIRDALISLKDFATGLWDLLYKGDYTGLPFGLDEDSGFVNAILTIRDTVVTVVQGTWDFIQQVFYYARVFITGVLAVIGGLFIVAFNLISWAVKGAWENFIKPVLDAFGVAMTWLWENVISPVVDWIVAKWTLLSTALTTIWTWIKTTVIDAFSAAMNWLWTAVILPVIDWIIGKWNELSAALTAAWNWIHDTVINAFAAAMSWLWDSVISPVLDWIIDKWNQLSGAMVAAWGWIQNNVINPFAAGIHWLWDTAVSPVVGWIVDKWNWMGALLEQGRAFVVDTVFGGLQRGLDVLRGWFQTAVDAIARIWDGIRSAAAKPVRFVVQTVFNDGIRVAWNAVAKFTGLDELEPVNLGDLGNYARGGVLPGYTPGQDVHHFASPTGGRLALSGGEAIMRPEWTKAVGGPRAVEAMNRAARTGRISSITDPAQNEARAAKFALGGVIQAFANGGVVEAMTAIVQKKYPGMQMTSGYRAGDGGMHGAGLAGDFSDGTGNTPAMLSLANDIADTYPGSAELIHDNPAFDRNIKNGSFVGPFGQFYTMGQAGPHYHHVHWAMTVPPNIDFGGGVFEGGSDGSGAGGGPSLRSLAQKAWDAVMNPIKESIPSFGGLIGKVPGAMFEKMTSSAWDFVSKHLPIGGGSSSSVDLSGVDGSVVDQVREVFSRHGWTGQEWEDATWIIQHESNFNPNAVNPSSGAYGIFQFLGGTKDAYLPGPDYSVPAQADAGARYIRDRYGSPSNARRFWEANHWYASGGVLPGYTPGRDVHHFVSPTGGALHLSGGEAIMRPEWTKAVGGARAVNAMNAAAAGGRLAPTSSTAFAAGGVWGGGPSASMDAFNKAVENLNEAATKLADATSVEGITARAGLTKFGEVASALGFDKFGKATSAVLGAEKELADARDGFAQRTADLTAKESALETARKALADAESASYDDDEKRNEAVKKATEDVTKAEGELTDARKKSASALDMRVYDVAPQIHQMLTQAQAATASIPALSGAIGGLAAAAGPAGVSVGVAVQGILTAINLVKTLFGLISDLIGSVMNARTEVYKAFASSMDVIVQLTGMIDKQRETVAGLRIDAAMAQIELQAAFRNVRITQMDGVRSQLEATKTLAEAQAKFDKQRANDMRLAAAQYEDLSLAYDRFRWAAKAGMDGALDSMATWSNETHALYAELQAARISQLIAEKQAQKANLEAVYKHTLAVLDLQDATTNLSYASQQLALMSGSSFGFTSSSALVGSKISDLYAEKAQLQAQQGQNWWKVFSWHMSGASTAAGQRMKQIDEQIAKLQAMPEWEGFSAEQKATIDQVMKQAGWAGLMGGGDYLAMMLKNSALGDPQRALDDLKLQADLLNIKKQQDELRAKIERGNAEIEHRGKLDPLETEISGLEMEKGSQQAWAEYWRAENAGVRDALAELAKYQAESAKQIKAMADEAAKQPVTLVGSSASMDDVQGLLETLGHRVERLENPRPTAAAVAESRR